VQADGPEFDTLGWATHAASNHHIPRAVRDAALECLQEMYRLLRGELLDNLKRQNIRPAMYKVGGGDLEVVPAAHAACMVPASCHRISTTHTSYKARRAGQQAAEYSACQRQAYNTCAPSKAPTP